MIKLFAFDIFGTLIDMSGVPHEELKAYGEHIRKPEWSPLVLPNSWLTLDLFPDVMPGIARIHNSTCASMVTLSNAPFVWQDRYWRKKAGRYAGEYFATWVPLEIMGVFKPNTEAYKSLFRLFPTLQSDEICMVSANEHFGDLEAARSLGMQAVLIRGNTGKDVNSLVELCE